MPHGRPPSASVLHQTAVTWTPAMMTKGRIEFIPENGGGAGVRLRKK